MSLIRSKSKLVIDAVITDNPNLPFVPSIENCYVYGLKTTTAKKTTAYLQGRFGTGYRGRALVTFNKYDVATMTLNCDRDVVGNGGRTTLAYLEEINRRYGFDLKSSEVQDIPVMSNGTICRLAIQRESLLFTGTVDLRIIQALPDLNEQITVRDLEPVFNPAGVGTLVGGQMLAGGHDYSEVASVLREVSGPLDAPTAATLSAALQSVDTVPWGIVSDTLYSLVGATVLYNGPIVGLPESAPVELVKKEYDNVLILTPAGSVGMTLTPIVFHYNVYNVIRS